MAFVPVPFSPDTRPHRSLNDNELATLPDGVFDALESLVFL